MNEIVWAKSHGLPRLNQYTSTLKRQAPSSYIGLLERYLKLVPYMAPQYTPSTLSHPDLHMDNIFVDPETRQITCIIDWQSTVIAPPYFQRSYPQMLAPIEAPSGEDEKEDDPIAVDFLKRLPRLTDNYQTLMEASNPGRWSLMHDPNRHFLANIVPLIPGSWNRDGAFVLRNHLVAVQEEWENVAPRGLACPFSFTKEEIEVHGKELAVCMDLEKILEELEGGGGIIPKGGKITPEEYDRALRASGKVKEWFVGRGETEQQSKFYSRLWPFKTPETLPL